MSRVCFVLLSKLLIFKVASKSSGPPPTYPRRGVVQSSSDNQIATRLPPLQPLPGNGLVSGTETEFPAAGVNEYRRISLKMESVV